MNNVNVNKDEGIKLIKNAIKDLSFENPQNINENYVINNHNTNLSVNMNVFYKYYDNKFFSLLLRCTYDCSSKDSKNKLFNLELDYYGLFEILTNKKYNQQELIKYGLKLLFPLVKNLVEDLTQKGGSVPITLNEVDFNLTKI